MPVINREKNRERISIAGVKELDREDIELLTGCRPGSEKEKEELSALRKTLGHRWYSQLVFALVHRNFPAPRLAQTIFNGIARHHRRLEALLGREIDVQLAAIDYVHAFGPVIDDPLLGADRKVDKLLRTDAQYSAAGLYDKGALLDDLQKEIYRTRRYGHAFAVLFIDIDRLGALSETHGSAAAALVLSQMAALLKGNLRAADAVYRFGGDEFVVLLPNADIEVARLVAEKLLDVIREATFNYGKTPLRVTASIGLESFDDQSARDVGDIFATVDILLSHAKRSGRNRIEIPAYERMPGRLPPAPPRPQAVREHERFLIRGTAISPGVALGRAYIYEDIFNEIEYYDIEEHEIGQEMERLRSAIEHVRRDVEHMEKQVRLNLGREYANIFAVHRAILDDMSLINEMETKLKNEKRNAEHIVRNVFKHFESRFIASENQLMRERSLDIADLGRRLLRYLAGVNRNIFSRLPKHSIVVAKRLLPSESVHLRRENVAGIITEKGSRNSHAAILARGLDIPYVSETEFPIEKIPPDAPLIIDAERAEVVVNPTSEDREAVRSAVAAKRQENQALIRRLRDLPLAQGNRRIRVMANVGTLHSMQEAVAFGCDGIGLYRIEQIYMQSKIFPRQEQLYRILDELFERVKTKPIVARLLDIGGDKTLPYFAMKDDVYSVLGVRGVRLLLRYPHLLETQLIALLKLSGKYRLSILIPMVTLPEEMVAVRGCLEKCKRTLERHGVPFNPQVPLGAMIEVPAAVLNINAILKHSDFLSIGTNDLIQYTMASARENAALTHYYETGTGIVLRYIEHILEQSRRHGASCSLCGELAADTAYTGRLLQMGLDIFSVSPASILKIKSTLVELLAAPAPLR